MTRWFRFYDETINDPKILRLSDSLFRAWVTVLCLASKSGGVLPSVPDIALMLRMKQSSVGVWLAGLQAAGLLDKRDDGSFVPHNWNGRQYVSDKKDPTNAQRQKAFRDRQTLLRNEVHNALRNGNRNGVTPVLAKRPDTDTENITTTSRVERGDGFPRASGELIASLTRKV